MPSPQPLSRMERGLTRKFSPHVAAFAQHIYRVDRSLTLAPWERVRDSAGEGKLSIFYRAYHMRMSENFHATHPPLPLWERAGERGRK
jgi:hypothetical protein